MCSANTNMPGKVRRKVEGKYTYVPFYLFWYGYGGDTLTPRNTGHRPHCKLGFLARGAGIWSCICYQETEIQICHWNQCVIGSSTDMLLVNVTLQIQRWSYKSRRMQ